MMEPVGDPVRKLQRAEDRTAQPGPRGHGEDRPPQVRRKDALRADQREAVWPYCPEKVFVLPLTACRPFLQQRDSMFEPRQLQRRLREGSDRADTACSYTAIVLSAESFQVYFVPSPRICSTCSSRPVPSKREAALRAEATGSHGTRRASSAGRTSESDVSGAKRHGTPAAAASNGTSPKPS